MAIPSNTTRQFAILLAVFCTMIVFKQVDAKRGCSSFGHSCFGGHGKRSEGAAGEPQPSARGLSGPEEAQGQEEVAVPRPVYPPTIRDILNAGDDIIPIRNGGFSESGDDQADAEQLKSQLSPYLRHWLISYRKAQQNGVEYPLNLI